MKMYHAHHSSASATFSLLFLLLQYQPVSALDLVTSKGCFTNSKGLQFQGSDQYMTQGLCQDNCAAQGKPVMGLTKGSDCYCGTLLPPKSAKTEDSSCSKVCNGFGQSCGGDDAYGVFLTGISSASVGSVEEDNNEDFPPAPIVVNKPSETPEAIETPTEIVSVKPTTKTLAPLSTTLPPHVVTVGGGTQVVTVPGSTATRHPNSAFAGVATPAPIPSAQPAGTSTGTKVGIAVGVVVGLIALGALIAGAVFFYKKRNKSDAVTRHRRNTSTNAFAGAGSSPPGSGSGTRAGSISDSRLDTTMVEREKRVSTGSVFADNEDYSRRILKVTNPSDLR